MDVKDYFRKACYVRASQCKESRVVSNIQECPRVFLYKWEWQKAERFCFVFAPTVSQLS